MVFVRHGETEWNASGTVQGRLDHELNERGRQQSAKVACWLSKQVKPAAVYSSDLKRAQETAKKIVAACPESKLVIDQRLTERDMGMFQGMNKHDATKTDAYKAYSSNNDRNEHLPGGGESLNQLSERCVSCLNEIADKHMGERVVVVSHEEVIQEICRLADPTSSDRRKIPNTSITIVHISGSDGQWTLEKVGDISHLAEDSFPEHASVMNQETD
ncbi:hypothetical protein HU200_062907 [Digitaria exilis]|uniref:Phosphoglycerate mutase n=1 Tax=Digitaria exilis TaxID=1010633 RepID=A0A835A4Y3_9POAL|nr:hypothetical protein HU200_062907 [Digitaria exilis]